jgi:hypothetical protein
MLRCYEFAWSSFDVAWPTPQDYNEAVQNPHFTFSDQELQGGCCEATALGLPKPISGNFASVYRLHCSGRDWAVRCFWRELTDMQQRYRAISAHLAAAGLSYTVGFEYQPQGIRIQGNWYPILKMEWVEGQLLNDYLVSHLRDPVALRALMDRWMRMVRDLERSGCAHGDLQHGNVLVVNGELKLVDYDGMFVPALAGMASHELGQQHYQDPRRGAADFGPQLDRFSTWVIYLSINALQVDPSLWTSTQAGDERLLLQRQDFENPASSTSLALLTDHADPGLQTMALKFRAALDDPLHSVPSLSSALHRAPEVSETDALLASRFPLRLRLLWRSLAPSAETRTSMHPGPEAWSHPAWVADYLSARVPEPATNSGERVHAARVAALAALPISGVGVVGLVAVGASALVATVLLILVWSVVSVVACIVAYRQDPAVRTLLPLVRREVQALQGIAGSQRAARTIAAKRQITLRTNARNTEEATARKTELQRQEKAKLDALLGELTRTLEAVDMRIHDVDRRAAAAADLALAEIQNRHITETLRRASLRSALIPGVGPSVKMRLWTLGIWAAADVSSERISSMQHLKHEHLMEVVAWRVGTETGARRTMPRQLPGALKQALHHRYARERVELVAERSHDQASTQQVMEEVHESFARRCVRVDERLTDRLEDRAQVCARLEARFLLVTEQESRLRGSLRAVRQEIQESEGVSFRQFVQSAYIPWTREESM